jgi:glucan biosynthesis protein C
METTAPGANRPASSARLLYVDNIRVFLTILVVLHHLMITYAGTGSWLYPEGREDEITQAIGAWFCAVNQAYFMGLFLLISAYFVPGAYDRKGASRFLKDRLIRLGIPLALYSWVIRPLFIFFVTGVRDELRVSFWTWFTGQYFRFYGIIGGGPIWFIETLLLFSLVYVLWRVATAHRQAQPAAEARFPSSGSIALFALFVAVATFVVRLWFPQDTSFAPLNLQFANFAQYIALFAAGLVAYRGKWFAGLPDKAGRRWLVVGILLVLLFPVLAFATGAATDNIPFKGGWHWQAFVSAVWESFLCVSLCIGLIYAFRRWANRQGRLAGFLVPNAYAAYLIHEPVIVSMAMALAGIMLYPLFKFILVSLVAVPLCFALSALIRKIPYADCVL